MKGASSVKKCERCSRLLGHGKRFCSYFCINDPFLQRFFKNLFNKNECWSWKSKSTINGYGKMHINGKVERAHRVSFCIFKKPIPPGMHVLHTCDNRKCVNPAHLYLGTDKENGRDRAIRNRAAAGEKSPLAKFPNSLIRKIRFNIATGEKITKEHSLKWGVSQRHLRDIVNLKTRKVN